MFNKNKNTLFLAPTDPKEIKQIIKNMNNKKSFGHDNIFPHLLKVTCYPNTYSS